MKRIEQGPLRKNSRLELVRKAQVAPEQERRSAVTRPLSPSLWVITGNKHGDTSMDRLRKRALVLADVIGFAEIPYSKSVEQASEELREHFQELDSQTQQEVMERIRGCFSD
jgi:hypothetical protein